MIIPFDEICCYKLDGFISYLVVSAENERSQKCRLEYIPLCTCIYPVSTVSYLLTVIQSYFVTIRRSDRQSGHYPYYPMTAQPPSHAGFGYFNLGQMHISIGPALPVVSL